ncbi:hypothetical protein [Sphaerotilus sp.]|uniref:hypothetical protein n=1 Tax=Sphaerotilus sp. TaxID=2093942 RepID=UPI0025D9B943|nr:hypothetical protein [Sphaerotilus sp.]
MCPAPGDPEALPVEILSSAGTLQPGRSAGLPDPVAFFLVLTFGRRSGDRADTQPDHQHRLVPTGQRRHDQHPAAHVGVPGEFLAGAGLLAGLPPLHAARPLQLLDVPGTGQPRGPALRHPGQRLHAAARSIGWPG